ncbi:MAG: CHRD domain-containing protein, partial [Isosphaeraceae bacterium]
TYFNIHTVAFPGGEIRGQSTVIPEPASLTLLTLGLGGILAIARFGRRLAA